MSQIIAPELTAEARKGVLNDMKKLVATFARRAVTPADRVAWAELEQELSNIRDRWTAAGLVAENPPGAAAA